ncbi:hypothetical protein MTO96_032550 [Rhipicephalus appendiculatus]
MGLKTLAVQLIFLAIVAVIMGEAKKGLNFSRPKKCGRNEQWKECHSSTCAETTCQKPTIGPPCTFDCISSCVCRKGFFRNSQGVCVTWNQCPGNSQNEQMPPRLNADLGGGTLTCLNSIYSEGSPISS